MKLKYKSRLHCSDKIAYHRILSLLLPFIFCPFLTYSLLILLILSISNLFPPYFLYLVLIQPAYSLLILHILSFFFNLFSSYPSYPLWSNLFPPYFFYILSLSNLFSDYPLYPTLFRPILFLSLIACTYPPIISLSFLSYSETLNNEYIGRIYQMSSWQF